MKLVIIITQKEDSKELEEALVENQYQLTKLDSAGGFLKKKGYTFLVGVNDEKLDNLLELVNRICKKRKEIVTSPDFGNTLGETLITNGAKVQEGGATIFVLEITKCMKV
jgi:uncharacterized protein YaaQ